MVFIEVLNLVKTLAFKCSFRGGFASLVGIVLATLTVLPIWTVIGSIQRDVAPFLSLVFPVKIKRQNFGLQKTGHVRRIFFFQKLDWISD